ncbi:MAG: hypothetical protein OSA95_04110 [Opitutales bacterium]|nr:hypothetical protein [Opitutales bacterium]
MRFYDTPAAVEGARYNTMGHPSWKWTTPGNPVPFPIIFEVEVDDSQLEFQDKNNPFLASIVANPEIGNASIYTVSGEVVGSGSIQGLGMYEEGSSAMITAVSSGGYEFVGWSGDLAGIQVQHRVAVTDSLNFTAIFQPVHYSVSAEVSPPFSGTVDGTGSNAFGSVVQISATPALGYHFLYWKGVEENVSANPLSLTLSHDLELQAVFEETLYSVTTVQNLDEGGVVSGGGIFSYGQFANITAVPSDGYLFVGWLGSGIANTAAASTHVTVSRDVVVTGFFEKTIKDNYLISLSVHPDNTGTVSGYGEYPFGHSVVLSAEPVPGYFFVKWVDDEGAESYEQSFAVILQNPLSYKAVFEKQTYKVQVFGDQEQEIEAPKGSGNYYLADTVTLAASPLDGFDFSEWSIGGNIDYNILVGMRMDGLGPGFFLGIRDRPQLRFVRGVTYRFFLDGTSTASHPFFFSTSATQENPDLFAGEFTEGVTNSRGVMGTVEIVVDESTPDSLYYYSGSQLGVGGNIEVIDPVDLFSQPNANPASLTVIGDIAVQALYRQTPIIHTLSLEAEPANGGLVSGAGSYVHGSNIQIEALPALGYFFVKWVDDEGAESYEQSFAVILQNPLSYKAVFEKQTYKVQVFGDQEQEIEAPKGSGNYYLADTVTLAASPLDGFDFSEWSIGGNIDYNILVGMRMDGLGPGFFLGIRDRPQLRFVRGVTYRFFLDGTSTASHPFFFSTSATQENPDLFAGEFTEGVTNSRGVMGTVEIVVDESTPDSLYYYSGSQLGVGGNIEVIDPVDLFSQPNANPASLIVIGDIAVQALYLQTPIIHTLSLEAEPANGGLIAGAGSYVHGSNIQIEALPSIGYYFVGWEGESADSSGTAKTVIIQSDLLLKARFAPNQITQFVDEEWRSSSWLGFYQKHTSGWVFSLAHGWIYPHGDTDSSVIFASSVGEWFWTSNADYPYIYSYDRESWLYYSAKDSTTEIAFFYDHGSGRWMGFASGSMTIQ